ncbi:hypothetical protein [Staphylococcus equorum]|uniref:hypothetical protein n=1 Tax=Staphylococcus equorum TaxID=246432 RepID=UPI00359375F6
MKISIKQLNERYELDRYYKVVFDNTITIEDFESEDEFITAVQESARVELTDYADHEYLDL